jgi:hypothetical protein
MSDPFAAKPIVGADNQISWHTDHHPSNGRVYTFDEMPKSTYDDQFTNLDTSWQRLRVGKTDMQTDDSQWQMMAYFGMGALAAIFLFNFYA